MSSTHSSAAVVAAVGAFVDPGPLPSAAAVPPLDSGRQWELMENQGPTLGSQEGAVLFGVFHTSGRGLDQDMAPPTKFTRYTSSTESIQKITAHNGTRMGTFLMKHKIISVTKHLLKISACQYFWMGP